MVCKDAQSVQDLPNGVLSPQFRAIQGSESGGVSHQTLSKQQQRHLYYASNTKPSSSNKSSKQVPKGLHAVGMTYKPILPPHDYSVYSRANAPVMIPLDKPEKRGFATKSKQDSIFASVTPVLEKRLKTTQA